MAAYHTGLNKTVATQWVKAAVRVRVGRTQASSMVKTGRWANTLVAPHRVDNRRLRIGGTNDTSVEVRNTGAQHDVTGLARITQTMPLRGQKRTAELGQLYNP